MDATHTTSIAYYRRLLLLAAVMAFVVIALGTQLVRLTVGQGEGLLASAERALVRETFLPTHRGRVFDRNGRVLAEDRPGFAVAVHYSALTDDWSRSLARHRAYLDLGATAWHEMDEAARAAAAEERFDEFEALRRDSISELAALTGLGGAALSNRMGSIHVDVCELADAVHERQLAAEARELGLDVEAYRSEFEPRPILEQVVFHDIESVADEVAFRLRARSRELVARLADRLEWEIDEITPVYAVSAVHRRDYPWSAPRVVTVPRDTLPSPIRSATPIDVEVRGVAGLLIGEMRGVWAGDVAERPFGPEDLGGYRPGDDQVGNSGIEAGFESTLRGRRGVRRSQLDTGEVRETPQMPGGDVRLTIDIALQTQITALLDPAVGLTVVHSYHYPRAAEPPLPVGWPLAAGVAVLEIDSGEVLALVSSPAPGSQAMRDGQIRLPYRHRAVDRSYPPGSIVKPLMLVAGVTEGVHRAYDPIPCTGHFFEGVKDSARCWIYRDAFQFQTHGTLDAADAVAKSCNIYFYTLADRLGVQGVYDWYRRFGAGRTFDLGLARTVEFTRTDESAGRAVVGEVAGFVPDAERIATYEQAASARFDTVILGIGQGRVNWTPLHAANAYAILVRGGRVLDPILVRDRAATRSTDDLRLDRGAVERALEGMRRSANEFYGTGNHIYPTDDPTAPEDIFDGLAGVTVRAKTGTAQAPRREFDLDRDGTVSESEARVDVDHSWYVAVVGPDGAAPTHAIAVLVEYGGSGGRSAGPIVHQIVRSLQAFGYLPGADES